MLDRSSAMTTVLLLALSAQPAAAQDARRGEQVYRRCLLCHVAAPKAKDLIAPPLHDIVGRRAATVAGFDYSNIMRTAGKEGLFWSAEALFYFLDRPEEFMPGTYMAFSGLDDDERRDVIAYLERSTADSNRKTRATQAAPPSPPPKRR